MAILRFSSNVARAALAKTSAAARSPDLTAPSIYPAHRSDVSVPAQCTRPCGTRSASPTLDKIPGPGAAM